MGGKQRFAEMTLCQLTLRHGSITEPPDRFSGRLARLEQSHPNGPCSDRSYLRSNTQVGRSQEGADDGTRDEHRTLACHDSSMLRRFVIDAATMFVYPSPRLAMPRGVGDHVELPATSSTVFVILWRLLIV